MSQNQETAVEFHDVSYSPNQRPIVSGLNFSIRQGESLVLLGRSGCGKTTTMKLINRLLTPSQGEVRVEGTAKTKWDPIKLRHRIGYVIQETGLFPHYTVEANVGIVPTLEGWKPKQVKTRAHELLNLVGLDPAKYANRYPHELSGGQGQRVGVARALAADPPMMLMDEPFGALDPITRLDLQKQFHRLQQELGKTVVFVTHDVREALVLATRVALMSAGRIVLLDTPEGFLRADEPHARSYRDTLLPVGELLSEFATETQRHGG